MDEKKEKEKLLTTAGQAVAEAFILLHAAFLAKDMGLSDEEIKAQGFSNILELWEATGILARAEMDLEIKKAKAENKNERQAILGGQQQ